MSTSYHMCLNVQGALLNWKDKNFKGMFRHEGGRPMTPREARMALMEELAKGHKVIPCGTCDNFDYSGDGCQGHEVQP